MATQEIKVPNIGGASGVEVIEVMIAPGDQIKKEQSLITLESDKASMEIPSPYAGKVKEVKVKVGDKVSEGSVIVLVDTAGETSAKKEAKTVSEERPKNQISELSNEKSDSQDSAPNKPKELTVTIPDIGDAKNVEVIEILVQSGTKVKKDESLITLEGEKATMEIPSPYAGEIINLNLKVGDKVSKGDKILTILVSEGTEQTSPIAVEKTEQKTLASEPVHPGEVKSKPITVGNHVHAGPAVRRLAREFGIDLNEVQGSGPKHRILTEDLQRYVKAMVQQAPGGSGGGLGLNIAKMPEIDFSKFGEVESVALNKIKKLTGVNVHRSWVTIPHVTQFGQADITEMEAFRKSQVEIMQKQGIKLTPLVFIMKAVVAALKAFPSFNSSLDSKGENLILKKYFNLGIAIDTPNGLVVPVIRDVDHKGMIELAEELSEISNKARQKGLSPADMSGGCFTISSLGGIGGTAFTPIINAPEVAILGVSKSAITAIYEKGQFVPRLMLPLSLSYDHRVIDGADGARFIVYLSNCLSDIRTLLL